MLTAQSQESSTQLQNQITVVNQINAQFDQQKKILEQQISQQTYFLQQRGQNPSTAPQVESNVLDTTISSSSAQSKKRPAIQQDGGEDNEVLNTKKSCVHEKLIDKRKELWNITQTGVLSSLSSTDIKKHLDSLICGIQLTPRCLSRKVLPVLKRILRDDKAWVFKDAVDPVELGLDNYFEVVKHPMHLGLVEEKLSCCVYEDIAQVESDVKLVFDNAILFNGEGSDIGLWSSFLFDKFDKDMKNVKKGKDEHTADIRIRCCDSHFLVANFL